MPVSLPGLFNVQQFTDLGALAVGGRIYTYAPSTTTHKTAYTDQAGTVAHTYTSDGSGGQYIALNARGELPAPLFLSDGGYDIAYKTSAGVTVWTRRAIGTGDDPNSLADDLAASGGAGLVGYDWDETYGTSTLGFIIKDKERSILKFLTKAQQTDALSRTGALDLTSPMTTAAETGELIYYPGGRYKFSRITSSIPTGGMSGDGWERTVLFSTDTTSNDLIAFTGGGTGGPVGGITVKNLQVLGTFNGLGVPDKAAGAAFAVKPSSGSQNNYSMFDNVMVYGVPIGIDFVRAEMPTVRSCKLLACPLAGVRVANLYNIDGGDADISGNVFSNPWTYGDAVLHRSSGGLRLQNNKILGGANGYRLTYESVAGDVGPSTTGILLIQNNSIENQAVAAVSLNRSTGSGLWYYTLIQGNEFAGQPYGVVTDTAGFVQQITVSGNTIQLAGSGTPLGIALDGAREVQVFGNSIKGNGGTSPIGVYLANCVDTKLGTNLYKGVTPYQLVSPTGIQAIDLDTQTGNVVSSTSGWAAYGALYRSALITVTFPQTFQMTPSVQNVNLTPAGLNGELGAVVNSVSTTQVTFYVVSAVTGIAASVNWEVRGVL